MKITGKMCIAFCAAAGLVLDMEQFDKGFRAAMEAGRVPNAGVTAGERWRHAVHGTVCTVDRVFSRKSKLTESRITSVRYQGPAGFPGTLEIDQFLKIFIREETQRGVYIGLKS